MFFTKAARIIAWLVFLPSVFQIVIGFALAFTEADQVLVARYLGSTTTGEAIERGMYGLILAVALGTLSEISHKVAAGSSDKI